jgi:hypothetical protein
MSDEEVQGVAAEMDCEEGSSVEVEALVGATTVQITVTDNSSDDLTGQSRLVVINLTPVEACALANELLEAANYTARNAMGEL